MKVYNTRRSRSKSPPTQNRGRTSDRNELTLNLNFSVSFETKKSNYLIHNWSTHAHRKKEVKSDSTPKPPVRPAEVSIEKNVKTPTPPPRTPKTPEAKAPKTPPRTPQEPVKEPIRELEIINEPEKVREPVREPEPVKEPEQLKEPEVVEEPIIQQNGPSLDDSFDLLAGAPQIPTVR